METPTSGLFIERLRNFQKIRDLQKIFTREQQNHGSKAESGISTSLEFLVHQKQTYAHLAAQAAMSYWRCDKSPTKIVMSYGRSVKSPAISPQALTAVR